MTRSLGFRFIVTLRSSWCLSWPILIQGRKTHMRPEHRTGCHCDSQHHTQQQQHEQFRAYAVHHSPRPMIVPLFESRNAGYACPKSNVHVIQVPSIRHRDRVWIVCGN
ncbi:hypothetical protein BJ546DRAFT_674523 [Cryomyces antarcticus]